MLDAANVKMDVKGKVLTMVVDLAKELGPSASMKSILIAKCAEKLPGGITVQVNIYKKPEVPA
jgi:hypothetical protein